MVIRKPVLKDLTQLKQLFSISIQKAFETDGFGDALEDISYEIQEKMKKIKAFLENPNEKQSYLIAEIGEKIIGAISFGDIGKVTLENVSNDFPSEGELGSMYILPDYQGSGTAGEMIDAMLKELIEKGICYVSFDCGYKKAQEKWHKKFGAPYKIIKNYWAEDVDLYIWLIHLEEYMRGK